MFPMSISGEISFARLQEKEADRICQRLGRNLEGAQATDIRRDGNRVSFRVRYFRGASRFNVLRQISRGSIEVQTGEAGSVRYDFSCLRMLFSACGLSLGMGSMIWFVEKRPEMGLKMALFAWVWFFGLSYFFALRRIRPFVSAAVHAR